MGHGKVRTGKKRIYWAHMQHLLALHSAKEIIRMKH